MPRKQSKRGKASIVKDGVISPTSGKSIAGAHATTEEQEGDLRAAKVSIFGNLWGSSNRLRTFRHSVAPAARILPCTFTA
jgi:hypothetical protein